MIQTYKIIELLGEVNWENFFESWGFDPSFASIANVQGCDVMRANWLTDFKEEDRADASKAMQLLKEAYRELPILDRDYKIIVEVQVEQPLLREIYPDISDALIATASAEIDLLYENDQDKRKLVQTLTQELINAAINLTTKDLVNDSIESITLNTLSKEKVNSLSRIFNYASLEIETENNSVKPSFAKLVLLS